MRTRIYIAVFLFILFPIFLHAQIDKNPPEANIHKNAIPISTPISDAGAETVAADGGSYRMVLPGGNTESIYYPGDWTDGTAYLVDGPVIEGMKLRFNMYSQQMQFIKDGDTAAFARPEELKSLSLDSHEFIYTTYKDGDEMKDAYFEVLTRGSCQLLLRREITYHIVDDLDDGVLNDSYILEQSYYVMKEGKPVTRIPMNKKCVVSALCDQQENIERYIKKNKLRFNNQDDMVRVVEYYNSL